MECARAEDGTFSIKGPVPERYVAFTLDGRRFALPLDAVETVVRAVEVTTLPGAPRSVLGVVDVRGRVVPVLDIRALLSLHRREVGPDDLFVIARSPRWTLALPVDQVTGVLAPEGGEVRTSSLVEGIEGTEGIIPSDDGLVLVEDLDALVGACSAESLGRFVARPVKRSSPKGAVR